jgi:uncharacterized protein YgbK (DUF1537 family)
LLLGCIADDFTGATDLCATLAAEGMRVVQVVQTGSDLDLPSADAVVVALKSRTARVADAVRDSLDALAWLRERGARQIFFKYCSTFDSTPQGNIGPVADALLDALGAEIMVACPAYPENGRTVYRGHLFVGDQLLSESPMAHHPLTPMTDPDIVRVLSRQSTRAVGLIPYEVVRSGRDAITARLEALRRSGTSYAIADALEDAHLRDLGAACAELPVVSGGSGIARGLPANFRARGMLPRHADSTAVPPVTGPSAVLSGSCSAATQEQVRRMAARYPARRIEPVELERSGGDVAPIAAWALRHVHDGPVLLYTTAPSEEVQSSQRALGSERASQIVECAMAALALRLVDAGVGRLVVAGGETAGAVVRALGAQALLVGPEIAPGIPWTVTIGDRPLALACKSGNFGGPDFFMEALAVQP